MNLYPRALAILIYVQRRVISPHLTSAQRRNGLKNYMICNLAEFWQQVYVKLNKHIMKAKMFKTVEEWMSSKPDPEITQKVLTIVNREVVSQMKRELNGKKSELRKVEKTVESMKVIGLPIGDAVEKKITELKKELAELQKELPEPVRKKSAE